MRIEYCNVCDFTVHLDHDTVNRIDGKVFCDVCLHWETRLIELKDKITDLKKRLPKPVKTHSPYDLTRRRQTSRQQYICCVCIHGGTCAACETMRQQQVRGCLPRQQQ